MARARITDNARSRSKALLIEEIGRGIEQFQDILVSIEDFSREGFPYRDAARAKAELQLRECVRRIFGERSPEFQTYRSYKLRTSNKGETAQSVHVVKTLIRTLEEQKLELQGLKPPAVKAPDASHVTLVTATASPAESIAAAQPVTMPPMTVSVALTTNLNSATAPQVRPQSSSMSPAPETAMPPSHTPPTLATQAPPSASQALPSLSAVSPVSQPLPSQAPMMENVPPPVVQGTASSVRPTVESLTQPLSPGPSDTARLQVLPTAPVPTSQPVPEAAAAPGMTPAPLSATATHCQDPLDRIRKLCLRFHAVTRQLRLRKDYRATLEVEDDYDLQDLLCALLKMEFDEVGVDEWTPPYTGGAPRTTFLMHREQIALVVKKTRSGLTTQELTDQVAADSARYANREKCVTLFCFIYDPEGRIGSPKQLETDLTSVSDRYMIEVLVAPK
jgi:hypothetical protein